MAKRRRLSENVVEDYRETHERHAGSDGGKRCQEFQISYPRDQYQRDQYVHHVHTHVHYGAEINVANLKKIVEH